jgi:hypothetical protein
VVTPLRPDESPAFFMRLTKNKSLIVFDYMAYDLTQRPFEGSYKDQAERLSAESVSSKKDKCLSFRTKHGWLSLIFRPTGRVEITWKHPGGIAEGYYMKDWTIDFTLRNWDELMAS